MHADGTPDSKQQFQMKIFDFNRGHYSSSVKVISENDTHIQIKAAYNPDGLVLSLSSKAPLQNHVKYDDKKKPLMQQ